MSQEGDHVKIDMQGECQGQVRDGKDETICQGTSKLSGNHQKVGRHRKGSPVAFRGRVTLLAWLGQEGLAVGGQHDSPAVAELR